MTNNWNQINGIVVVLLVFCLAYEAQAEFATIGRKNYYIERNLTLNWYAAWNYCAVNDMKLLAIETEAETAALRGYLAPNYFPFWTSGNDLNTRPSTTENRRFFWASNGQRIVYTNWNVGEPNNLNTQEWCIEVRGNQLLWNDIGCYNNFRFICEY